MTASSLHDVLLRPVISEKSVGATEFNTYTFAVRRDANKFQIKAAVEAEFKVTVLGVRVMSVKPKQKRRGRRQMGTVPGWRKAVVTIAPTSVAESASVSSAMSIRVRFSIELVFPPGRDPLSPVSVRSTVRVYS